MKPYMADPQVQMDPGEKELRMIFEKTTTNNIKAIIAYNDQTQELVKKLESHVRNLDGIIRQYDATIENLKQQITVLQTRVFQGGS